MSSHEDQRHLAEVRIRSLRAALGLVLLWSTEQRACDVAYDAITADGMLGAHGLALRAAAQAVADKEQERSDESGEPWRT
jgi:hypothetical protein